MAFSIDGFYPDPRAGGVRIHTYSSADAIATVNTSGYFNDLSDVLNVRDIILVTDTATPTAYWVIVLSNASGVVDVSDGTVIAETDSD
jgi:hypothetical protein